MFKSSYTLLNCVIVSKLLNFFLISSSVKWVNETFISHKVVERIEWANLWKAHSVISDIEYSQYELCAPINYEIWGYYKHLEEHGGNPVCPWGWRGALWTSFHSGKQCGLDGSCNQVGKTDSPSQGASIFAQCASNPQPDKSAVVHKDIRNSRDHRGSTEVRKSVANFCSSLRD